MSEDDSTPENNQPDGAELPARERVRTRPFPYGIKDSVVPGPPDDGPDTLDMTLPLGAGPTNPSMRPHPTSEVRPPRPGRSPLSDPAMPDALLDERAAMHPPGEDAAPPSSGALPQGVQNEFDAMLRELDASTGETSGGLAEDPFEDDANSPDFGSSLLGAEGDEPTNVAPPNEHILAAEKRDNMESFAEDSSTGVNREAPQYGHLDGGQGRANKLGWTLAVLLLIAAGVAIGYWYFLGGQLPFLGQRESQPTSTGDTTKAEPEGDNSFEVKQPPQAQSLAVAEPDAAIAAVHEAGVFDAGLGDVANTGSHDAGDASGDGADAGLPIMPSLDDAAGEIELPAVPQSVQRLSHRIRTREATKQLRLGNRLFRRKRNDSALWHYQRALTFDPKLASAARGLSRTMARMERVNQALAWARYSAQLEPDSTHAWTTLAEAYEAHEQIAEAIDAYQKALELSPTNRAAKRRLSALKE